MNGASLSRRALLAGAASALASEALAQDFWLDIMGDNGKSVPNMRAPSELMARIDALPGAIRIGADHPDVRLVEFYDLNCPFCRKAALDIEALLETDSDLGVTLIDVPILSPQSKQAALHEVAALKLHGKAKAHDLHRAVFTQRGLIGAEQVKKAAGELGLDAEAIAKAASDADVIAAVNAQLDLAAALGVTATPSFVAGNFVISGYPGAAALARMITALRTCDNPAC